MPIPNLFVIRIFLAALLILLRVASVRAQLYPGDANNDGIVNNIDILYIGYAYGASGPIRLDRTLSFAQVNVPLFWNNQFPDSTNFVFADTDGNGVVDFQDFLTVYANYGSKRLNPQPMLLPLGVAGFDPQLRVENLENSRLLQAGDTFEMPILLEGVRGDTLRNLNGIAFSLEYDRSIFKNVTLDFTNSWLGNSNQLFPFQTASGSRLEAAVTRFGKNPVSGKGKIGILRAVIEDDLIELLTRDSIRTTIRTHYIKAVDDKFRDLLLAGGETPVTIYSAAMLVANEEFQLNQLLQIFPNPTHDALEIRSPVPMQRVEIFSLQGQLLAQWQLQSAYTLGLSLAGQPPGVLCVKVATEKGTAVRKVVVK
jgi:hypothetical protein